MDFKREANAIQTILSMKEGDNKFSGVVYIRNKEDILFSSSHGFANRTWNIKNDLNTKFRIGSISKLFTAVAVLNLMNDHKLSIDDKIHTHLNLKDSSIPEDVTLYHLLTHTSGIGDYFDEMNSTDDDWFKLWERKPIYTFRNLSDYYDLFKDKKALYSAGEKFHYCGAGYILLGMLIERMTQKKYSDYIKEVVFEKIGLKDTKFIDNEIVEPRVADGYEPEMNKDGTVQFWRKNIFTMTPLPASDGGATSTVEDLVTFSRALRDHTLLDKELSDLILLPKVLDQNSNGFRDYIWKYSFANWFLLEEDKIIRYGHTGEEFGVSTKLYYYPEKDIDVIILGNQGFCTGSVGWAIHDVITDKHQY